MQLLTLPPDPETAPESRRRGAEGLAHLPDDCYDLTRVDFGVSRARAVTGVLAVEVRLELTGMDGVNLVFDASTRAPPRGRRP